MVVSAAGTRFKGRRTISRYDREPREMYYLFVVSRASLGMSGLREKHPYVCYKGRALFAGTAPYVAVMYSQRESANGTGAAFLAVRPVKCDPFFYAQRPSFVFVRRML